MIEAMDIPRIPNLILRQGASLHGIHPFSHLAGLSKKLQLHSEVCNDHDHGLRVVANIHEMSGVSVAKMLGDM
jgi:hypothetical protein